jgi:hypothetical protein
MLLAKASLAMGEQNQGRDEGEDRAAGRAAHILSARLPMGEASSRNQSSPYSVSARGLRRAWRSARSCEAASTNPSVRLPSAHTLAPRLLSERRTKAWRSARSCEAASTNPSVRLSSAHTLAPRLLLEKGICSEQSAPRPSHAQRAIWAGRAARSCEAASTDRGRASTSGSDAESFLLVDLSTMLRDAALQRVERRSEAPAGAGCRGDGASVVVKQEREKRDGRVGTSPRGMASRRHGESGITG